MLGIINDGLRSFVIDTYSAEAWDAAVSATGVDKSFVSACPYPDEVTYSVLTCLAEQHQQDPQEILERYGYYFCMVYVRRMGYERLLRCMGANLVEFLHNLNIYHIHLSVAFKEMKPPAFRVADVTPDSVVFHYSSQRRGLTRFAIGLLRGAAKLLYDTDVDISILQVRGEDDCSGGGCTPAAAPGGEGGSCSAAVHAVPADTDTFLIRFPPVAALLEQSNAAATCRLALDPPTLFQLFPFHLVLDSECRLVQVGRALSRLYPGIKPGRLLTDFFTLRHPYIPVTFERLLEASDNLFVLRSCINDMELKGQVHHLQMPLAMASSPEQQQHSELPQGPPSSSSSPLASSLPGGACPHLTALLATSTTATNATSSASVGAPPSSQSQRSSGSGVGVWSRTWQRLHPAGGDLLGPVLLFLGSPRIASMEEMRAYGLFVSDLPMWDTSRETMLLAEQRCAEAALRDTFERLSLQLEEERQRSDQLLYQMIPRHIADSLRRGQRVSAETYPEATILFSDVVNFTTIAAGSTAMEVCNMLDDLYNEFDALVDQYPAVYKVETIGDAYMLVANVTQPCPDHVNVVLDFALDMQRVANRVTTNRGAPIQIRVGVHTGSVVGGVVGRKMPRFHLFGDAVNTASRMESHGLAGAVHISAASRALIRNPSKYLISERGEISVKGKGMMETFLVSRADAPSTAHLLSILASSKPDLASVHSAALASVQHIVTEAAAAAAIPCGLSGSQAAVEYIVHTGPRSPDVAAAAASLSSIRRPNENSMGSASRRACMTTDNSDVANVLPLSPSESLLDTAYELELALQQFAEATAAAMPPGVPLESPLPPSRPPPLPSTPFHPYPTESTSPPLAESIHDLPETLHPSSNYCRSFLYRSRSSIEDGHSDGPVGTATAPATASGYRSAVLTPRPSMLIRVPSRSGFYLRLGKGASCSKGSSQADLDNIEALLRQHLPRDPMLLATGHRSFPPAQHQHLTQITRLLFEPPKPHPDDESRLGPLHRTGIATTVPPSDGPDPQPFQGVWGLAAEVKVEAEAAAGLEISLRTLPIVPLAPNSTPEDLPPLLPPAVLGPIGAMGAFMGLPATSQLTPPGQLPIGKTGDIYIPYDEHGSESLHRLARQPDDYENMSGYGI